MGCRGSKQARQDLRRSPSPLHRANSLPFVRHRVSLTSSTLGSLKLDPPSSPDPKQSTTDSIPCLLADLSQARSWSKAITTKMPKTPTQTPPNEPEAIDTLELMEGLEDSTAFDRHSFSFCPPPKLIPTSKHGNGATLVDSDFDPDVVSAFRKAMEELSPQHPLLSPRREPRETESAGIVRARVSAFQQRIDAKKASANNGRETTTTTTKEEGKVVVVAYLTTLRGVRRTYEDCCSVMAILRGYGVKVDERDLSMHAGFREEMKELGGGGMLPRVFVDGKELGGAEEVRRMHEEGELGRLFQGWVEEEGELCGGTCGGCGDVRFVLCDECSGSCKVYDEEEGGGGGWRRCSECNENGIVRCPVCC